MEMCRWMRSHFHDWSDYNGVAFSIELLEWGRKFSAVWGHKCFKIGRISDKKMKVVETVSLKLFRKPLMWETWWLSS